MKKGIWTLGVGVVIALFILDTLFVGNIAYLAKWRECGVQPLVVSHPIGVTFGDTPERTVVSKSPGIFDSKKPLLLDIGHTSMYCSLKEITAKFGPEIEVR